MSTNHIITGYDEHDYPEYSSQENGNYQHKCQCGADFIGPKYRNSCRVCWHVNHDKCPKCSKSPLRVLTWKSCGSDETSFHCWDCDFVTFPLGITNDNWKQLMAEEERKTKLKICARCKHEHSCKTKCCEKCKKYMRDMYRSEVITS